MRKKRKGVVYMATSTFDRKIQLDDAALEKLIKVLEDDKPVKPLPRFTDEDKKRSEELSKRLFSGSKT